MRYKPGHKEKTHKRILESAARLFRERGFQATGIPRVMADAGLTVGGFYSHFKSKDALLCECLQHIYDKVFKRHAALDGLTGREWLEAFTEDYLSAVHRDTPADGCPVPLLGADVSREDPVVRQRFGELLESRAAWLASKLCGAGNGDVAGRERALALAALLAGGLMLSRAVDDEAFSDEILESCRKAALDIEAGATALPEYSTPQ